MTFFKKGLCAFMAALLLLSACACGTGTETETEANSKPSVSGDVNSEGETKEMLEIPDTRYDDEELIFLTRDEAEWSTTSIYAEKDDISEDPISEAVYTRNDMLYQNYGVIVKELKENTSAVYGKVQNEVNAPTGEFHAVVTNVSNSANFSNNTLVWDLYSDECSNLDLSKSWWDQRLVEGLELNDRIFFATGDLLTLDNDATFVMMFNKTLATECQLPDLYSMVSNYEWTFDKLFEYEQLSIEDPDGDGTLEYDNGVCGFALTNDVFYSMFYAGGLSVITRAEDESLAFGLNVERAQNVADSAKRLFSKDYIVNINDVATSSGVNVPEVGQTCFGEGHALFFGEVLQCVERLRGYDIDFGVIPYPMYDSSQKAYYHMMHITGSVVSIPRSVGKKNIEMVSSMIEALAYYSVDTLTKQYYEINLTTKNVKDEQSGPMIDLILASRVCDLAYYYGWGGAVDKLVEALKPSSNASIASSSQSLAKAVNNQIKRALKKIDDNYVDN